MNIEEAPSIILSRTDVVTHARLYRRGTRLGRHVHREAQLLFAASGIMQVSSDAGRWLVPPQRAVWLPSRFEHAVDVLADIEMRTLYFDPEWLAVVDGGRHLQRVFVISVRPLLRAVILALFDGAGPGTRAHLLARLALLEMVEAEDFTTFMPMPSDKRARMVADMVLLDPASGRELEDFARAAGVSARTLTRLFPAETDLTFKEWRQRARIMAAVEALGSGRPAIKQVAGRLGFSSVAAFSHAFGQVMGMTPTAFAQQAARSR